MRSRGIMPNSFAAFMVLFVTATLRVFIRVVIDHFVEKARTDDLPTDFLLAVGGIAFFALGWVVLQFG